MAGKYAKFGREGLAREGNDAEGNRIDNALEFSSNMYSVIGFALFFEESMIRLRRVLQHSAKPLSVNTLF